MAGLLWALFGLSLLPFVAFPARIGCWFLALAVPFKLMRWRQRFGSITSTDAGFKDARRAIGISFFLWLGFVLLYLVIFGLGVLATATRR